MKTSHRTGYGVFDISRQIARRIQQEWENVESPTLPPMNFSAEVTPPAFETVDQSSAHCDRQAA